MSAKSWRECIGVHPACEMFPLMSTAELRALGADIKKNGLKRSISIYSDSRLLDGRNRLDGMEAVGLAPKLALIDNRWRLQVTGVNEDDIPQPHIVDGNPYEFVASVNVLRRHLTIEKKRELIAKLIKATPDKSDRQIAETVKASPTTVGTVRAEMEATGDVSKLDTRKDIKGRQQPARRPRQLRIPGTRRLAPPAPPKPSQRNDIGPDSAGELERLRARNEELTNESRRLQHELRAADSIDVDELCARIVAAAASLEPAAKRAFLERLEGVIADLKDALPPILNGSDHAIDGADDLAIPPYLQRTPAS